MWARYATVLLLFGAGSCSPQEDGLQRFWTEFRRSAMSRDYAALAAQTTFPLELRGAVDGLPPRHIERPQFDSVIQEVLEQQVGEVRNGRLESYKVWDLLARTTDVREDEAAPGTFRVGELVFEKQAAGWKLVAAYLSEEL